MKNKWHLQEKLHKKNLFLCFVIALFIGGCNFCGAILTGRSGMPNASAFVGSSTKIALSFLLQVPLFTILFYGINWLFTSKIQWKSTTAPSVLSAFFSKQLYVFGILMLCYLPALLAYFPAVYSYDANVQLEQWISGIYNKQHPLLHTLFLGMGFSIDQKLSSIGLPAGLGFCFISFIQMGFVSYAISRIFVLLHKKNISYGIRLILLLYFALHPQHRVDRENKDGLEFKAE